MREYAASTLTFWLNDATTVQAAVIAAVVKVLPANVPPQVPPTDVENPAFGVTVNIAVAPNAIACGTLGLMVPLVPADGVTMTVLCVKLALTVQGAVMAAVV